MTDHQQLVSRNVRRFRRERGLSMSALAHRAGLSKQTLSTLEQGVGNPTVETLAVLAAALDVSIRRLLTEWGTPVFVQRAGDGTWVSSATYTERFLDEVYGSGYVRTLQFRLERRWASDKPAAVRAAGALFHLYVVSGRVRVGPVAEPVDLDTGDFTRFPGDVPHLLNALTETAVAHVVITEPQVRQMRI
jgi:transcriptional regulator with XRE-family HTH domain